MKFPFLINLDASGGSVSGGFWVLPPLGVVRFDRLSVEAVFFRDVDLDNAALVDRDGDCSEAKAGEGLPDGLQTAFEQQVGSPRRVFRVIGHEVAPFAGCYISIKKVDNKFISGALLVLL